MHDEKIEMFTPILTEIVVRYNSCHSSMHTYLEKPAL